LVNLPHAGAGQTSEHNKNLFKANTFHQTPLGALSAIQSIR